MQPHKTPSLPLLPILLSLVAFLAETAPAYFTYQVTLWQGGTQPKTITDSPYSQNFVVPLQCDLKDYQGGLVQAGLSVQTTWCAEFEVSLGESSSSMPSIELLLYSSLSIYSISFFLVLVNNDCLWLHLLSGSITPTVLDQFGTGPQTQTFSLTAPVPVGSGGWAVYPYFKDYKVCTNSASWSIEFGLTLDSLVGTDQMVLLMDRTSTIRKVTEFSYTILIVDSALSQHYSISSHVDTFEVYIRHSGNMLFHELPQNFDIPANFLKTDSVDGNCLIGLFWTKIRPSQSTTGQFDARTNPISKTSTTATNNASSSYSLLLKYIVLCFDLPDDNCLYTGPPCLPFSHCEQCSSSQCILCEHHFCLANNSSCQCCSGWEVNNLCTSIAGCVSPYYQPDGTPSCLQCDDTQFQSLPIDGECRCLEGQLVISVCNTIPGCLVPVKQSSQLFCHFCNVSSHFQGQPTSEGSCLCEVHYQMKISVCVELCGDGVVMEPASSVCDDSNTVDGDGCSGSCQVETFYRCYNGSRTHPSECVYQGPSLNLTLRRISRSAGLNQGIFKFQVDPPIDLNKMDLQSRTSLSCPSSQTTKAVSYQDGVLELVVDYDQDLEGLACTLHIAFEGRVAKNQQTSLNFDAVSNNMALVITHSLSSFQQIQFIFGILGYVVLGIFLLALPLKMAAVELIVNCQLVYLSRIFFSQSMMFSSLEAFQLVSGYRPLFDHEEQYIDLIYPSTGELQLSKEFLQNMLIPSCVFLAAALVCGVFMALSCWQDQQSPAKSKGCSIYQEISNKIYGMGVFPLGVGFFLFFYESGYLSASRLQTTSTFFAPVVNSLVQLFTWTVLGTIISIELIYAMAGKPHKEIIAYNSWYVPFFLLKLLSLSLLVSLFISNSQLSIIYAISGLTFLNLLILIVWRPYSRAIHNVGAIACETASSFAVTISLLSRVIYLEESTETFILFILEGLLALAIVLTLLRSVYEYYSNFRGDPSIEASGENLLEGQKGERRKMDLRETAQTQLLNTMNPYRIQSKPSQDMHAKHLPVFKPRGKFNKKQDPIVEDSHLEQAKDLLRKSLIKSKEGLSKKK